MSGGGYGLGVSSVSASKTMAGGTSEVHGTSSGNGCSGCRGNRRRPRGAVVGGQAIVMPTWPNRRGSPDVPMALRRALRDPDGALPRPRSRSRSRYDVPWALRPGASRGARVASALPTPGSVQATRRLLPDQRAVLGGGVAGRLVAGAAVAAVGTLVPPAETGRLFELAEAEGPRRPRRRRRAPATSRSSAGRRRAAGRRRRPGAERLGSAELQPADPDDLALAIFTSGTTGPPQGHHPHPRRPGGEGTWVAAGYTAHADYRPGPGPGRTCRRGASSTPSATWRATVATRRSGSGSAGPRCWSRFTVASLRALARHFRWTPCSSRRR